MIQIFPPTCKSYKGRCSIHTMCAGNILHVPDFARTSVYSVHLKVFIPQISKL